MHSYAKVNKLKSAFPFSVFVFLSFRVRPENKMFKTLRRFNADIKDQQTLTKRTKQKSYTMPNALALKWIHCDGFPLVFSISVFLFSRPVNAANLAAYWLQ